MIAFQAIETRYHGPTNTRGSRYSARGAFKGRGSTLYVSAPPGFNSLESHAYAARAFAERMGWDGRWTAGGTRAGYVFVRVPDRFTEAEMTAFTIESSAGENTKKD